MSKYIIKSSPNYDGDRFFTRENGITFATPLLMCLVCIEISDVVFAIDSIPAVLGVSHDPFVVYTSNIFAIMGLRSLYTVVSKAIKHMHYLKPAVGMCYIYIYITHTHIHIYTYIHIYIYIYNTDIHTHIHINTYTHIHICTYAHIHIYIYIIHTYITHI